jgi:hypothetical protein
LFKKPMFFVWSGLRFGVFTLVMSVGVCADKVGVQAPVDESYELAEKRADASE